jgi:hypothetical protein
MSTDELLYLDLVVGIGWEVFALCHSGQEDATTEDRCWHGWFGEFLLQVLTQGAFWCPTPEKVAAETTLKYLSTLAIWSSDRPLGGFLKHAEFPDLDRLPHLTIAENRNKFSHSTRELRAGILERYRVNRDLPGNQPKQIPQSMSEDLDLDL